MTRWLSTLSPRDSRLLALLVLAFLIWIGGQLIVSPLVTAQSSLSGEIEKARKQLGRIEAVLARANSSDAPSTAPETQANWQGTSSSVIAANVQNRVQQLAQTKGVTIVSISQTQSKFSEEFETAGLVIEGHGEAAAFVDLFSDLERHQPILFVDNLVLRRYRSPAGQVPGSRLQLATRFEIHAPHHLERGQ